MEKTHKNSPLEGMTKERTQAVVEETLAIYPEKAREKRAPHMSANDPDDAGCAIRSNRKTIPGVMSARGCAYAGA